MNGTNSTVLQQRIAFENISKAHAQINDFFAGTAIDMNAVQRQYPLLYVDLVDVTPYEVYTDFVWQVGVFDILRLPNLNETNQSYANQWEIISDSSRVLKDILLILRDSYDLQVGWGKAKEVPKIEYDNDNLAGAWLDITISIPDDTALDQVPLKS
jgi:hypothetical protein